MELIELHHLSKSYGSVTAVQDLSLTLNPGRVTGLIGASGSGKSTKLRMLFGLTEPTAESATIGGCRYADLALVVAALAKFLPSGDPSDRSALR
jgi:ABC-2 type transport system ATP-binding protein